MNKRSCMWLLLQPKCAGSSCVVSLTCYLGRGIDVSGSVAPHACLLRLRHGDVAAFCYLQLPWLSLRATSALRCVRPAVAQYAASCVLFCGPAIDRCCTAAACWRLFYPLQRARFVLGFDGLWLYSAGLAACRWLQAVKTAPPHSCEWVSVDAVTRCAASGGR